MVIWHLTPDAPRFPFFVSAGQNVNLQFRTWPIEGGQRTWIDYQVLHQDGAGNTGPPQERILVANEPNRIVRLNDSAIRQTMLKRVPIGHH